MKKILVILLAFVLVIAMSVTGTFAYLTAQDKVVNTFVAGKILDDPNDFVLKEHEVQRNEKGIYEYSSPMKEVDKNDYTVVPGSDLPKDPFVRVKTAEDAYLFIEVAGTLPAGCTWYVDTANWTEMTGVNPATQGGKVYKLAAGKLSAGDEQTISILCDNTITVADDFNPDNLQTAQSLTFNAFLCQSTGFDTAEEAWTAANFTATK